MALLCPKCQMTKAETEFYRGPKRAGGYRLYCKPCTLAYNTAWRDANRPAVAETKKRWTANNVDKVTKIKRRHKAKTRYGLTAEEYAERLQRPCAICGSTDNPNVDHCHTTGIVRGTLCWNCNVAIGHMREDQGRLYAAAAYLRKWKAITDAQEAH